MAKYLIDASYTAEGMRGLIKDGAAGRKSAVAEAMKPLKCKIEALYFAFGKHDVVLLVDCPDNVTAAAIALAVNASGMVQTRTTVLMTVEEVDEAIRKVPQYKMPGAGGGR